MQSYHSKTFEQQEFDRKKKRKGNARTSCPMTVAGKKLTVHVDSLSDFFLIERSLWKELEGREVYDFIEYGGIISGTSVQSKTGKWITLETPTESIAAIAHPMEVEEGDDCHVIIPMDVAAELGIYLSNMPNFFKSKVEKISVEEWLNSTDSVQLVEEPLSDKEREKVLFEVNESIARNVANVPENSCCNIPGCEFKITLIPEARPSFKQQYGCAEAIMPMVKQRMEEWFKNSWTEPFPEGEKNLFNSPWLAVAKKSGGKIAVGDLRLCMDFREINKWSIDPEYFIPRAKDLLSKVWGMKVFTELRTE